MGYKFIQPVSMRVTEEQYQRDLREPLLKMGYEEVRITDWDEAPILATNYEDTEYILSNIGEESKDNFDRYFIPDYNPELFLAIAAMTKKELPIVGEWLVCIKKSSLFGYKIGQVVQNDNPPFGLGHYHRRATLQELIEKFTNQKQDIMKEITTKQFEELKNLIAPENEEAFNKIMGIKKPIPKKEELITGDKVVVRNGCIYLVIENCNAGYYGKQVFTLLRCNMNGGFLSGHFYDNELRNLNSSDFDIMKVYRFEDGIIVDSSMNGDLEDYDLVWSR